MLIKDFSEGLHLLNEQFIVTSVTKSSSSSGRPYVRCILRDKSGTIVAIKWNLIASDEDIIKTGKIISLEGMVEKYRDQLQLKIENVNEVYDDEIKREELMKVGPKSKEELVKQLEEVLANIEDEEYLKITKYIYHENKEAIFEFPAAISVHHDFSPLGLLTHLVTMGEVALKLSDVYAPINKSLLLSATLLHDIAKTKEYEKESISFQYSTEGKLLGHISMMAAYIDEVGKELKIDPEKIMCLKHLVLSHHGQYEYGSPVLPMMKEAILLHMIDDLDAKMMVCDKALDGVEPGEFSQKVMALDNRVLYKSKN